MSLIGNVTLITVTGRFVDLQDRPLSGQVTFTPSTAGPLINAQGQVIVGNGAVTATLDNTGQFAVALPASDDPNLNPRNFTYRVSEPAGSGRSYNITVPRNTSGGILDLYSVAPSSDASAGVVQAVSGTSVIQGVVDPQGHLILTFSDGTTQDAGSVVTGGIDLTNYYTKTQADQAISTATATLVSTSDSRLSNARTPIAHAVSHRAAGADPIALDQLAAPSNPVNGNGQRFTNLADPTSSQDAATRAFVLANAGGGGGGGGLSSIQAATDYDNSNAASDGQAIVWSSSSSKFAPGSVVAASDGRLTNARTPTSHAATHASGGSDAVSPAAIGAATATHAHAATDTTSGTFALARIPTGTTSSTVALGQHSHAAGEVTSGTLGYARLPVGTTAGSTVCDGGDSRLSNSRTPLAHASSHATAGSDAVSPSSIGAAAASHTHAASAITSGTVDVARLPVGTSSSTVAAGNDSRFTGPVAYCYASAPQALTANTPAPVAFGAHTFDTAGGHSTTTATSRYTCQVAGYYWVSGLLYFGTYSANTYRAGYIYRNGVLVLGTGLRHVDPDGQGHAMSVPATLIQLAVNDYVELWASAPANVAVSGSNGGLFSSSTFTSSMSIAWGRPV